MSDLLPETSEKTRPLLILSTGALILLGLYLTSLYNYLLFHTLAEIFSIVVAFSIFTIAWNARRLMDNAYPGFLGIAYLFIGSIDLLHTLAYKGMGVFHGHDANLPTQLWIAGRYLESLSLLTAALILRKTPNFHAIFIGYAAIAGLLLAAIFHWRIFPDCYVEGVGLTPFKKISEYIISLILLGALICMRRYRSAFDPGIRRLLTAAILLTIGSELTFTFYTSVYGLPNFVGHGLKILSFYLIYRAIVQTGVLKPYALLFRDLHKLSSVVHQTADTVMITDREGLIEYINPAFERLSGYSRTEVLGRTPGLLKSGQHPDSFFETLWQTILSGQVFRGTVINKKKNGDLYYIEQTITPIVDDRGRITYFVSTNKDVTEQKKIEETLKEAERVKVLAETAGAAAHEINQPLFVLTGLSDLLMHADVSPEYKKDLEVMRNAARQIAEIVRKMGQIRTYATKPYLDNVNIVDFDGATRKPPEPE